MTLKPVQAEPVEALRQAQHLSVISHGFAFVVGTDMHALLASCGSLSDWPAFAASWNALEVDPYMADQGRYRRRRHAAYAVPANGPLTRSPHQAHYQTLEYNPLHGGIARWFEPILDEVATSSSLRSILNYCRELFGSLAPTVAAWQVEVHQFRIEAQANQPGLPTPEGAHRDGADYVLVLLITRQNIAMGTTHILDLARQPLGSFTLSQPFDAALVDDARVYHGVTAVEPLLAGIPAYRDVLVVTFRRQSS